MNLRSPPREQPTTEVEWQIGKHDWSGNKRFCRICYLERTERKTEDPPTHDNHVYKIDGYWGPVPVPCVPRLKAPIEGLFPLDDALKMTGLTRAMFSNLTSGRSIRPAAVTPHNVYLWRWEQLEKITMDEQAWEKLQEPQRRLEEAIRNHILAIRR